MYIMKKGVIITVIVIIVGVIAGVVVYDNYKKRQREHEEIMNIIHEVGAEHNYDYNEETIDEIVQKTGEYYEHRNMEE